MNLSIEQLIKLIIRELKTYKITVVVLFSIISLGFLSVGFVWPKIYTSSTTILSDNQNIIQPLLEGTAVSIKVNDRLKLAEEMINSRKIMHRLLLDVGLIFEDANPVDEEILSEKIKKKITITSIGKTLIRIEFRGSEPKEVFLVTKTLADLFVQESVNNQNMESVQAFNFISKQVDEYHKKLIDAETKLKVLRTENFDAGSTNKVAVNGRIAAYRKNNNISKLALQEEIIKLKSFENQLSGEAEVTITNSRVENFRKRIARLQSELDLLRLNYQEEHPDVIRIKNQIIEVTKQIAQNIELKKTARENARKSGDVYVDQGIVLSALYEQLRSEMSKSKTAILTLRSRISETDKLLKVEFNRLKRNIDTEAELAELTRDYEVNRDMYTSLLTRRERANISMNLGKESTGPSFNIQEPARLPLVPSGLRFLHFMLAGFLLGILVPIGLLYLLVNFDPRVRDPGLIEEKLNIPVLVSIPGFNSSQEVLADKSVFRTLVIVITVVMVLYLAAGISKFAGVLS